MTTCYKKDPLDSLFTPYGAISISQGRYGSAYPTSGNSKELYYGSLRDSGGSTSMSNAYSETTSHVSNFSTSVNHSFNCHSTSTGLNYGQ